MPDNLKEAQVISRNITVVTANLGRGVPIHEFQENVNRLKTKVPGKHRFFGFQEVDEADGPEEHAYLREVFGKTHRFAGMKTAVPIAVPRSFKLNRTVVSFASPGVAHLTPNRYVVQAVVSPDGYPDKKVVGNNTHFARNIEPLEDEREDSTEVVEERLLHWQKKQLPAWLTGDLNERHFEKLGVKEERWVGVGLDYVRGYQSGGVKMTMLNAGTVDLTIDGHNAHWARVQIVWP